MPPYDSSQLGAISPSVMAELSGIDLFRKIIASELPAPPVCAVANQWITEAEVGRIVFHCAPPPGFTNPMGTVHGGWAMTVLDSALGCAVHTALPAGRGYTTIEVKTNLTRGPKVGAQYQCEGKVITLGRRTATSEARLTDDQGRVVAFGTTTCMILDF